MPNAEASEAKISRISFRNRLCTLYVTFCGAGTILISCIFDCFQSAFSLLTSSMMLPSRSKCCLKILIIKVSIFSSSRQCKTMHFPASDRDWKLIGALSFQDFLGLVFQFNVPEVSITLTILLLSMIRRTLRPQVQILSILSHGVINDLFSCKSHELPFKSRIRIVFFS